MGHFLRGPFVGLADVRHILRPQTHTIKRHRRSYYCLYDNLYCCYIWMYFCCQHDSRDSVYAFALIERHHRKHPPVPRGARLSRGVGPRPAPDARRSRSGSVASNRAPHGCFAHEWRRRVAGVGARTAHPPRISPHLGFRRLRRLDPSHPSEESLIFPLAKISSVFFPLARALSACLRFQ
jgi:hypothetical protein